MKATEILIHRFRVLPFAMLIGSFIYNGCVLFKDENIAIYSASDKGQLRSGEHKSKEAFHFKIPEYANALKGPWKKYSSKLEWIDSDGNTSHCTFATPLKDNKKQMSLDGCSDGKTVDSIVTASQVKYEIVTESKAKIRSSIILVLSDTPADDDLPPDPGEAGKKTIAGIDSDNDGVRDDVQRWIHFNFPKKYQYNLTLQVKFELKNLLATSQEESIKLMHQTLHIHGCLFGLLIDDGYSPGKASKLLKGADEAILNTEERIRAHIQTQVWFDGQSGGGLSNEECQAILSRRFPPPRSRAAPESAWAL